MTSDPRGAVRSAESGDPLRIRWHIDRWRDADGAAGTEIRDPADSGRTVAVAPRADARVMDEALSAAREAAPAWAAAPGPERADVLMRAADAMESRSEEIAVRITSEMGKIIAESRAETGRAIGALRFFAHAARSQGGATFPLGSAGEAAFSLRVPLGVVGLITPWNFPVAIPTWKIGAALAYGNAVVLKPSEAVPMSAAALVECLLDGGLPPGVLSLVLGPGSVLGAQLVASSETDGVSFTGSTAVGRAIAERASECATPVQCEMGGRNATVVLADADLDAAVEAVVLAGFGTSGQRCTSASRVIVERPVRAEFVDRLLAATEELVVGPGLDPRTNVGPLASAKQLDDVLESLERAVAEGEEVLVGGGRLATGGLAHGHYMAPTVTQGSPDSWFSRYEVFGPVISVFEAADYEEAVRINNGVEYGLSSAIFTRDLESAMRFVHETDTGMVHVNRPTIGAEAHIPFGGAKASSIGPPELGGAWQFFTKSRSAHIRWS